MSEPPHKPVLNRRILARNPAARPAPAGYDDLNRPLPAAAAAWGRRLWARIEEEEPRQRFLESGAVYEQEATVTIRKRTGLTADAEFVDGATVWRSKGPPAETDCRRYLEFGCLRLA